MAQNDIVDSLKENNQDFEWYPTTSEIIECVKKDIDSLEFSYRHINEILDIGAGDGRVLKELNSSGDKKIYSIEKSEILRARQDKNIIPLGCDFFENSLMDKEMDMIFSNPPYSCFEVWSKKIIKEANAKLIYLVIPNRWQNSKVINNALKSRNADFTVIGSFDFLSADRQARANIDIVRIKNSSSRDKLEAFDSFLNEFFNFKDDKELNFNKQRECEAKLKEKVNHLAKGKNQIEVLVELYDQEMKRLTDSFKSLSMLDKDILENLGIKKETIKQALVSKINGLKNLYWNELFNRYEPITEKMIFAYRDKMLRKLYSQKNIDFNLSNIYAVTVWFLKNASANFNEQIIDFYLNIATIDNIKTYKSNRHFTKDSWRYNTYSNKLNTEKASHYSLDYRIVLEYGYTDTNYNGGIELSNLGVNLVNDFIAIARNLGFAIAPNQSIVYHPRIWSNEKYYIYLANGEILLEYKGFKNGNMHLKINQEILKALNIEVGRLLGWLKSPSEASLELDISETEASKYFGSMYQIAMDKDIKLLSA